MKSLFLFIINFLKRSRVHKTPTQERYTNEIRQYETRMIYDNQINFAVLRNEISDCSTITFTFQDSNTEYSADIDQESKKHIRMPDQFSKTGNIQYVCSQKFQGGGGRRAGVGGSVGANQEGV